MPNDKLGQAAAEVSSLCMQPCMALSVSLCLHLLQGAPHGSCLLVLGWFLVSYARGLSEFLNPSGTGCAPPSTMHTCGQVLMEQEGLRELHCHLKDILVANLRYTELPQVICEVGVRPTPPELLALGEL